MDSASGAEAFFEEYPGTALRFVVIDLWDGTPAQVQAFETSAGIDQSVLTYGGRTSGVAGSFAAAIDHFFVVDGEGVIRYEYARRDGFPAWRPDDLRPVVEDALAASAGLRAWLPLLPGRLSLPSQARAERRDHSRASA